MSVVMESDLWCARGFPMECVHVPLLLSSFPLPPFAPPPPPGPWQRFVFPADLELAVGDTVTVWSGRDADKHEQPPRHLKWTRRNVWNDNGDVGILKDSTGEVKQQADCTPVSADEIAATQQKPCYVM